MKNIAILTLAACFAGASFAATIPMPFNTGVQDDGMVAAGGTTDLHYTASGSTVYVEGNPAYYAWLGANTSSAWVGPNTGDGNTDNGGYYTLDYQTSFDLAGFDPATVSLSGQWSIDNVGSDIILNGTSTGNTAVGYNSWSSFIISSGFASGINTLDFSWTNEGGPGGLRVEFTSLTGDPIDAAAAPEPGYLSLVGIGLGGLVFFRRRFMTQN